MNSQNEHLINLSKTIVLEMGIPNMRYATVGGSVGRGEADNYSDIDLNVYISSGSTYDRMFIYEGEMIQLYITDQLPMEEQIKENPWEFRFILETIPIHDPNGEFDVFKKWVHCYFSSIEGREKLAKQAIEIVNIRKKWAIESLNQRKLYSAKLGAGSAWADASFLYLFFVHNTLSTGSLIPLIKNIKGNYDEYIRILPFSIDLLKEGVGKVLRIVERHREFLRLKYASLSHASSLSPLQDVLMLRKTQRLYHKQQYENMLWQLSGEVFMLYLEFSEGQSFEEYFNELPKNLQEDLTKIGFITLDEEHVLKICKLSDELVDLAMQFMDRNMR